MVVIAFHIAMDLADQQVGDAIIVPEIGQGRGAVPV